MQDGKHVILCVDDDPDICDYLTTVLQAHGYAVAIAESAEQGVRAYKKEIPDLIIVDLMMEEIDAGANLVKELKVLGNVAPVYMLTSMGDQLSMITDYTTLGLSGVFQKTLDDAHLLSILAEKLK